MPQTRFDSIKSQSALRLLGWLSITVLIQALVIVFLVRGSARSRSRGFSDEECRNGTVFVYDLPPAFNKRFVQNCHDLNPWRSWCAAVSNGGFGPKAAANLQGLVPGNIIPAWYWTDMYAAEVIYHVRMLSYRCRTLDPENATAFYVPFYAGLAIGKYLWFNYTSRDRDRDGEMLLNWLQNQPSWKKRNGADHVIVFGRLTWDFRRLTKNDSEWGSSFIYMPLMKNVLKITVERSPWDELEYSVPYPTAFHPRSESDIVEWQHFIRARNRPNLFCFVGAARNNIKNDFRGLLMDYCKAQPGKQCRLVDCSVTECSDGSPAILEAFLDSDFCLQPKGDGYTRRSSFDCMLAGSIPVYFWEGSFKGQYEWHLPLKAENYSVFIDNASVRNGTVSIRSKLEGYSKEEVQRMRETLIDLLPRILYAESSSDDGLGNTRDAFDITIQEVLRKLQHQNLKMEQSL